MRLSRRLLCPCPEKNSDPQPVTWLSSYHSWIILVGTFVFGDTVVLAAAGLAAHGQWSVWAVVAWAFMGTLASDSMWFKLADRRLKRIRTDAAKLHNFERVTARLDGWVGSQPHRGLLFIKFVWGTRMLSIVYMAAKRVSFGRFFVFDTFGIVLWLAIMVPIGWFVGKGMAGLGETLTRVEYALPVLLAVGLLLRKGMTWLTTRQMAA